MITLLPMTDEQFAVFAQDAIRDYAADKRANGLWSADEALERAREIFGELLPQGPATPDHHLYVLRDPERQVEVGTLWLAVVERAGRRIAYVYGVDILAEYRRQGYATQAFRALEDQVGAWGLAGIALHVFGHNSGAQALYESLGYAVTDIMLFKALPPN
jgi:ribosomal protein S18 acetylase RimI-like enzyme